MGGTSDVRDEDQRFFQLVPIDRLPAKFLDDVLKNFIRECRHPERKPSDPVRKL